MIRTFEPVSDRLTIIRPRENSEFEIQAYLYCELVKLGVDIRGELRMTFHSVKGRRETCRFDLVIFDSGVASRIIEVKNKRTSEINTECRQLSRYRCFGIPVTCIVGMEQAIQFVDSFI